MNLGGHGVEAECFVDLEGVHGGQRFGVDLVDCLTICDHVVPGVQAGDYSYAVVRYVIWCLN